MMTAMIVQNLDAQTPFTTRDGSTIRSILDRTNAPVRTAEPRRGDPPRRGGHPAALSQG